MRLVIDIRQRIKFGIARKLVYDFIYVCIYNIIKYINN